MRRKKRPIAFLQGLLHFLLIVASLIQVRGATPRDARVRLEGPLVPFGLCFQSLPPAQQVRLCQSKGFTGLGLAGGGGPQIKEFAELPEVRSGKFRIYSVLWWAPAKVDFAGGTGTWLDGLLDQAARTKTSLWMVSDGPRGDKKAWQETIDSLCEVARRCRAKHVQLVLYPHMGCVYETAEESLTVYRQLAARGYPEVKTSIHLCHELKAGNGDRIAEIVEKVAPHLALATVSGGDIDARGRGGWETAIMPLGQGTYDPRPYLRALAAYGYRGPVELHTYGLPDPQVDDHLTRSRAEWQRMVMAPR